jgi:hypothetical protein
MFSVHVSMNFNLYHFSYGYVSVLVGHSRMLCVVADMLVMLLDPSLNGEDAYCTPFSNMNGE